MSDRQLIKSALYDAIEWQNSLADAYAHIPGSPERRDALDLARRYRAMLARRYSDGAKPHELPLKTATLVSVEDLRAERKS